jgi:hypothetical protein
MTGTDRSFDKLQTAVSAAMDATDLQGALVGIVQVLQVDFDLWGAGILASITNGGRERARILASWSVTETLFEPGVEIDLDLTPELRAVAEVIRNGRPVVVRNQELDLGLLGHLTRKQGSVCTMAVPLAQGKVVPAALLLGSARPDGFSEKDIPFFTGLAKGIEEPLLHRIAREMPI